MMLPHLLIIFGNDMKIYFGNGRNSPEDLQDDITQLF